MAPKVMSSSGMMCSLSMSHSLADRVSLMLLLESLMSSALASLELLVLVDLVGRSVGFGLGCCDVESLPPPGALPLPIAAFALEVVGVGVMFIVVCGRSCRL